MNPASERRSMPVRLPPDLHKDLKELADSTPGTSMNDLLVAGVRKVLNAGQVPLMSEPGAADAREDLVIAALSGEIGAIKGIAQHYGNMGLTNLSCLLYGLSAEVTAATDPKLASKELVRTASRLPHRSDLAFGLLRAALRYNPENEVAKNHLGQRLYTAHDYKEAVEYLASVRERDNHAKLFHGFASLYLAREADNRSATTRARDEIVVALEAWAFGNQDTRDRNRWLRRVAELDGLGADYQQTVDELLAYANDNTSWSEVSRADLSPTSPTPIGEDLDAIGGPPTPALG